MLFSVAVAVLPRFSLAGHFESDAQLQIISASSTNKATGNAKELEVCQSSLHIVFLNSAASGLILSSCYVIPLFAEMRTSHDFALP